MNKEVRLAPATSALFDFWNGYPIPILVTCIELLSVCTCRVFDSHPTALFSGKNHGPERHRRGTWRWKGWASA